ncbi:hypothetical protein BH09VER1_BH09VER1_22880 [soil metagenome]
MIPDVGYETSQTDEYAENSGGDSELFALCFNSAPIGIALLDPRGHWLQVNDAVCRIVGYSREELLKRTFQEITHPEDLETDLGLVGELLAGERTTYQMEKRYLHKGGHVVSVNLTATLLRNADRSPKCFISHIEDITESVRNRENLKELSERLQLATEAARIGVIDYDIGQEKAFWDDRMFALYGIPPTPDRMIDIPGWMPYVHPEDLERLMADLRNIITEGLSREIKYRIIHPELGTRTLRANARVVCNFAGTPIRCVAVTHDITEQERAETDLHAAKEAAEAANRAKSAFLAMMSHEIRTPLHGIIGYTDLLAESGLNEKQREQLSTIETSGEMLLAIIEDILDYSKIEAGKLTLEQTPFSLRQCVEASVGILSPRAAAKGLNIKMTLNTAVAPVVIGDQMRLQQVLTNLLSNAVKFTSRGEVSLRVEPGTMPDGRTAIHFQVSDTGIGISEEKIAELFKPFSQLDASTTRRFGGTGLGLAICRALVSNMGGQVELTSRERTGTDVHVLIPFITAEAETEHGELPFATMDPAETNAPASAKKFPTLAPENASLHILVAEDNPINRRLIHQVLLRCGATNVEVVNDGEEAIERLSTSPFDVILMDCQMPRIDGFEATREIRRMELTNPLRARTRIIALTASAFEEDRRRAFESGMDDFLTKPLRTDALVRALSQRHS